MTGERTPLKASDHPSDTMMQNPTREKPPLCTKSTLAMSALVVAVVAAFFLLPGQEPNANITSNVVHKGTTSGVPLVSPELDDEEDEARVMYRPFCETYGTGDTSVRLLQTSMQNPSLYWTAMPCFHAKPQQAGKSGGLLGKRDNSNPVFLATYGAPDARFQVNFSNIAFPQRETPILGFGGAFTEAAALNFHSLDKVGQETVLELLFGKTGLGYSNGRVHINSCDFSVESYSFDDEDGDFKLRHFDNSVYHDVKVGMVDFALRATAKLRQAWTSPDGVDGRLRLFASPWSPPAWMKMPYWKDKDGVEHSKYMTGSAQPTCIRDGTGPDSKYARAWALYFSKFLTAYENLGLPFFAVTPQNEPEFPAPWEACAHTSETEANFVGYHLGPQLKRDHPNVKIAGFDHNKDHINTWVNDLINSTSPSKPFIGGTAYHWYAGGNNRILDGALGAPNMHRLQSNLDRLHADPEHFLIGIESCHCPYTGYGGGDKETYWARAERYGHTILADLAAGSNGWMEWNFILDSQGGPNHLDNLCDSSLLAVPHRAANAPLDFPSLLDFEHTNASIHFGRNVGDDRTRAELNAMGFPAKYLDAGVVVQPMYFYMGHISRYVRPGSRAVTGLVDQPAGRDGSLTFRPKRQVVAGGGQNGLAQPDVELTLWPCEGSTRQVFQWDSKSREIQVFGHDWLGNPITSCIGNEPHKSLLGLVLVKCDTKHAGTFNLARYGNYTNFVLTNGAGRGADQCAVIEELKNEGGAYGPRGGAPLVLGDCASDAAKFQYDQSLGEISSTYLNVNEDSRVCLTTGWPFLQMGAFDTPNGESMRTVVVLNEANDAANYVLRDDEKVLVSGSIPPRSIQTLLID